MAIEIKELVIRASIDYPATEENAKEAIVQQQVSAQTQEDIIKACVKQVMKLLKQQQKR